MNIKEAKEQIEETAKVYLSKDEYGSYIVPLVRQRPIFLLGAPGIGKTAIMEQVASEMGIALVSYSMTHHTRQSALGLPLIRKRTFDGREMQVTEYTMSEIIASIYEEMEKTGRREGILFLDEINCVSETLSPSMLQFLQYKTFGTHRVPDGWVVVTAGNPPQFNRSVREFDVVTMDRLKILEIDPDYPAWREYAENRHIHRAILTYLDIKKDNFYTVETRAEGKTYVTARGWEDLSEMMMMYEKMGFPIDESLIGQYLGSKKITQDFALYYELFSKYRSDYQVYDILSGQENESVRTRAKKASFDERISLTGLLLEAVLSRISGNIKKERELKSLMAVLRDVKAELKDGKTAAEPAAESAAESAGSKVTDPADSAPASAEATAAVMRTLNKGLQVGDFGKNEALHTPDMILKMTSRRLMAERDRDDRQEALSHARRDSYEFVLSDLKRCRTLLKMENISGPEEAFALLKKDYDSQVAALRADAAGIKDMLDHLFGFTLRVFGEGNEMLILVTELTVHSDAVVFIGEYGCDEYARLSRTYQLYQKQQEIMEKLGRISDDTLQAEADKEKEKKEDTE